MKNKLQLSILALSLMLSACASGPAEKKDLASAQVIKPIPAQTVVYVSARSTAAPEPTACPHNEFWKKEHLRNILAYSAACARLQKHERLEQLANFLAQNHHQTPWGPFYLAIAAEQRKEYPRALWMIDLAIKKSPATALLHYEKGRIHWALSEYRNALTAYQAAVKADPKLVDAQLFLAQVHFRDQDYKLAAEHFANVLKYESDNGTAAAGLGETYALLNNMKGAVTYYEKAVHLSPRNVGYRFRLAGLYETVEKNYVQALTAYQRIQTLLAEQRSPAEEQPFDLKEKIRRLEEIVAKAQAEAKKVTRAEAQPENQKVKK